MPDDFDFTLQLGVILAACRLCGIVPRYLGRPQLGADMAVGFLRCPVLPGLLVPEFQKYCFR